MLLPPSMHNNNGKIGFNTYVMWGLCFVVIGACYVYEEHEKKSAPAKLTLPADVQKALPSGAWLMSTSRASPSPPHARRGQWHTRTHHASRAARAARAAHDVCVCDTAIHRAVQLACSAPRLG